LSLGWSLRILQNRIGAKSREKSQIQGTIGRKYTVANLPNLEYQHDKHQGPKRNNRLLVKEESFIFIAPIDPVRKCTM
jgi:hypothetical protein